MTTQSRLLAYLKPYRKILAAGLICAAITAVLDSSLALFINQAMDAMTRGQVGHLNFICGALVFVFLVKGIFTYGQSYFLSLTANKMVTRLREQIFSHLHSLSLSYFNRQRTGTIISVLTNDVPVIQEAAMSLRQIISAPLTIIICLAILFWKNWFLALISLLFIPCMAYTIQRIGSQIRRISRTIQNSLASVTNIVEETVAGARAVKSFAAERHEIDRFRSENDRTLENIMTGVRRSARLRPITDFIGAFGIALIMFLGGNMVAATVYIHHYGAAAAHNPVPYYLRRWVLHGGMTVGGFTAFLFLLDRISRSFSSLGGIVTLRGRALGAAGRIFDEVLDVNPEVEDRPGAIVMPVIDGSVKFDDVSFRYDAESPLVLDAVSFEMRPGEVVALVGKSGAGKSTLADLIPRFYDPTHGAILIDGIDVRNVQTESLRRQIGIVPQETWLFAGTLRDNVCYGYREATDAEVWHALRLANAAFVESFEAKLDTIVGDRGVRLSGGEKQRISIARAILMNPRILILDEATSSLDAASEALVQEALEHLMKGRTTLVIAHRLSTIVNADRIVMLDRGKIVETGSHRELMKSGGPYSRLYETQLSGFD